MEISVSTPSQSSESEAWLESVSSPNQTSSDGGDEETNQARIPRPRNKWIIYRQHKSRVLHEKDPHLTAGEICKYTLTIATNTLTYRTSDFRGPHVAAGDS